MVRWAASRPWGKRPNVLLTGDQTILIVAYSPGIKFVELNNGIITQKLPNLDDAIYFSAWSIVRRQGDESKNIFDFKLGDTQLGH